MSEMITAQPPIGYVQATRQVLRAGVRPLLLFEAGWRLLLALALGPLAVASLNALVRQSGQPAITNAGLLAFALSPLGVATGLLGATLHLTLTALESAGLVFLLRRALRGRAGDARLALWATLLRLPALAAVALAQVVLALLAALPFLAAAGLVWWLLLSGSDINYYLARKPPAFLTAAALGAVLGLGLGVVLLFLYLRWLFAVPACVFAGRFGWGALRASADLGRGHYRRILLWLVGWQALRAAVSAVALFVLDRLNHALLDTDVALGGVVVRTVICLGLDGGVLVALSVADAVGFALLILVFYERFTATAVGVAAEETRDAPPRPLPGWMRYAALAGLAFLAVSALGHAALLADQFGGVKPVGVTAHRAGALHAPENTLAALRQAIAEGADAAEIDVQETADGVVVVLHDQDLRRLTGVARNVWEITSAELRALDAGSWFGPAFRGEHIATLEEFLEAAKGKIRLNVELKYNGHDKKLAERVIDLLRKHDFLNQAVITSLEYRGLEETRRLEPNLKTGYIVSASVGDLTKLDVDFLSVREGLVTPALCREAGGRGWPIHAWGVNDRPKMEAVLDLGADDLITDNVVLALEVLRERAARPKPEIILARLHAWLRAGE